MVFELPKPGSRWIDLEEIDRPIAVVRRVTVEWSYETRSPLCTYKSIPAAFDPDSPFKVFEPAAPAEVKAGQTYEWGTSRFHIYEVLDGMAYGREWDVDEDNSRSAHRTVDWMKANHGHYFWTLMEDENV